MEKESRCGLYYCERAMEWDYYLPKFGYEKDVNVCSLPDKVIQFIYDRIDEKVEPYFTGHDKLYVRNGWLPGWSYNKHR